ncbi:hypothetical protein K437DRAFT_254533 [Tilletiaria anomala UBC 951]|uniref:Cation-transporting ATPase n=1 Tax=Tilletiaria anomala (strain ATCC 24038 / CBS 436.72 / UBC 951) TaxID=1037660 RepID=A0A066WMC4_TILAU|nr:uncharacterized protein K437DRAFT_254533 [Tilletiaria anomala UBC 951]KDN52154.1 hypothetical protein K437DRAFT_254533 [Tilletiaria anomala UBC 951]
MVGVQHDPAVATAPSLGDARQAHPDPRVKSQPARFLFHESSTAFEHAVGLASASASRAASTLAASDAGQRRWPQSGTFVNDAGTTTHAASSSSSCNAPANAAISVVVEGEGAEQQATRWPGYGSTALDDAANKAPGKSGDYKIGIAVLPNSESGGEIDDPSLESDATQQKIYLPDEDLQLNSSFWAVSLPRLLAWYAAGLLSVGLLLLFGYWFPVFRLRAIARPVSLQRVATAEMSGRQKQRVLVCMRTKHSLDVVHMKTVLLQSRMSVEEAFPPSLKVPFESAAAAARNIRPNAPAPISQVPAPPASCSSTLSVSEKFSRNKNKDVPQKDTISQFHLIIHRYTTFIVSPLHGKLLPLAAWRDSTWTSLSAVQAALDAQAVARRQALFGKNLQQVNGKSVPMILFDEILHPFLVFTLCAIALWSYDDYQWYALIIGLVTIAGVSVSTYTAKRAYNRMEKLSAFTCPVSVYRLSSTFTSSRGNGSGNAAASGSWMTIDSSELVPGDVLDMSAHGDAAVATLACDAALLQGGVIVNESMLTGEAMPVAKTSASTADLRDCLAVGKDLAQINKHILYSGTKVLRVAPPLVESDGDTGANHANNDSISSKCTALVVRTGFNTTRGSLIRAMMFPKPIQFKFYRDCVYFIIFLVLIAILGFLGSLVNFIRNGVDPTEIALRALDLFTICVPPAIPAAQAAVIAFALARLRMRGVTCTSPQRINVSGRANLCCFDKTGTLTHTDLDVLGTRATALDAQKLTPLQTKAIPAAASFGPAATGEGVSLTEGLATAHDLSEVNGTLIGEPLEVKMFKFSEWTLDSVDAAVDLQVELGEQQGKHCVDAGAARTADGILATTTIVSPPPSPSGAPSTRRAIVQKYDFVSTLRRMSVLVRREDSTNTFIYCKGAPEQVEAVCDLRTLPADLNVVLGHYTHAGYRVLGLAGKCVPNLSWAACQRMRRSQAESDLTFLGLLIFENRLKDGTAPALAKLHEAGIPTKMVTGDSVLTAIAVAKEAGMVESTQPVFVARLSATGAGAWMGAEKGGQDAGVEWIDAQHEGSTLNPYSLIPHNADLKLADIGLAMTGETFHHLLKYAAKETRERALVQTQIFARMSPEQKQELVEQLQQLAYTVAFCGDGANDCGALKAADVGVSLSEAESSVAAPFTSSTEDISCMDGLIREGRSCLQTSCTSVLFLAIYSITEYMSVILLYIRFTSFDNAEYLFIDVFIVLSVMLGLANSHPAQKLAKWAPPSRLMSRRLIVMLIGHVGLMMLAQAVIFVILPKQSDYIPPDFEPTDLQPSNLDNSAIFRISLFPYLVSTICFAIGPPHRQIVYKNLLLCAALSILLIFSIYFLFLTGGPFFTLFGFVDLPAHFQWLIFAVAAGYTAVTFTFHFLLLEPLVKMLILPVRAVRKWRGIDEVKKFVQVQDAIRAGV